jgi:hypothetical protein
MAAQIKALAEAVTKLSTKKKNNDLNTGNGKGSSTNKSHCPQMKKLHSMGGYCHSHGFHPVGASHNSTTCSWKKEDHKTNAMWTNRPRGNIYWPITEMVAIEQQNHPLWKAKAVPTS